MSSEHAVVEIVPCDMNDCGAWCRALNPDCLGDGRRALLDQTVAVERMKFTVQGQVVDISTVWVES